MQVELLDQECSLIELVLTYREVVGLGPIQVVGRIYECDQLEPSNVLNQQLRIYVLQLRQCELLVLLSQPVPGFLQTCHHVPQNYPADLQWQEGPLAARLNQIYRELH